MEAIFIVILSKFDGDILQSDTAQTGSNELIKTPCAEMKNYLAKLISGNKNQLELLEQSNIEIPNTEISNTELSNAEYPDSDNDIYVDDSALYSHNLVNFKLWAQLIADRAR